MMSNSNRDGGFPFEAVDGRNQMLLRAVALWCPMEEDLVRRFLSQTFSALLVFAVSATASAAAGLSREDVNTAGLSDFSESPQEGEPHAFLIRLQILLDRKHVSPGVIDGLMGDNLKKALEAFEDREGLDQDGEIDEELWSSLEDDKDVLETYEITADDLSQRYAKELPEDYSKQAELEWLGYEGPREMLAERFHMDEDLLAFLNPDADFEAAGTEILVAAPGDDAEAQVARIVVDGGLGQLFSYDSYDRLVAAYPATVGSRETPSPSGRHTIEAVAIEPTYTYDPKNFQQGDNDEPLELPPGPNGPVGLVWIDLSEPTYGIHGTPDPAFIDKSQSHGCVRLTNWDAKELAEMVEKGVEVEFKD